MTRILRPMDPETLTLSQFLCHSHRIFGRNNRKYYSNLELSASLGFCAGKISKCGRTGDMTGLEYLLPMCAAWSMSVAHRFNFRVSGALVRRFPNVCPCCGCCPCDPLKRVKNLDLSHLARRMREQPMREDQAMLHRIYPHNKFATSAAHVGEEGHEVNGAVIAHTGSRSKVSLAKANRENLDVIANLYGTATCAGLDLATLVCTLFEKGCPVCEKPRCKCLFRDVAATY